MKRFWVALSIGMLGLPWVAGCAKDRGRGPGDEGRTGVARERSDEDSRATLTAEDVYGKHDAGPYHSGISSIRQSDTAEVGGRIVDHSRTSSIESHDYDDRTWSAPPPAGGSSLGVGDADR